MNVSINGEELYLQKWKGIYKIAICFELMSMVVKVTGNRETIT
jgi:hypothetical protein